MIQFSTFNNRRALQNWMNDVIVGKKAFNPLTKIHGLHGLTVIMTTPAVTVTFAGQQLFLRDVVDQINTATGLTTAKIRQVHGNVTNQVELVFDTEGDAITGGTALTALGLSTGVVGANQYQDYDIVQYITDMSNSITVLHGDPSGPDPLTVFDAVPMAVVQTSAAFNLKGVKTVGFEIFTGAAVVTHNGVVYFDVRNVTGWATKTSQAIVPGAQFFGVKEFGFNAMIEGRVRWTVAGGAGELTVIVNREG